MAVPFVDKDGVEDGDQGKSRRPRDHGRDYLGESLYPSTRAIRKRVPTWSQGILQLVLDLHCPWIRGEHNEDIYIVGSADLRIWEQQCLFGKILEKVRGGPLPYKASDNLPFGQSWNLATNYSTGKGISRWGGEQPGVRLSTTLEIPYANAGGAEVNPISARLFGHDLAAAIRKYLILQGAS